jgi:hypothetical protein
MTLIDPLEQLDPNYQYITQDYMRGSIKVISSRSKQCTSTTIALSMIVGFHLGTLQTMSPTRALPSTRNECQTLGFHPEYEYRR